MRISTDNEASRSAEDLSKAEELSRFGLFFQKMGELDLAVSVYQRVLDLGGDSPDIRFNLGSARLKQIRPTEALEHFKAGVYLKPQESGLHLGMANAHKLLGDLTAAEECLEKELAICPESIHAAVNLGWILEEQNRVPEALVQYRKAMYYNVQDVNLRWNHGLACLMLGDYSSGWRDYEYRHEACNKQKPAYDSPEWNGEPLSGRKLLVYTEQGFGDSIMFFRFALMLGAKNDYLALHCQPALKRLFMRQGDLNRVTSKKDPPPAHDVHASMMSLPLLLKIETELDLNSDSYLTANSLSTDSFIPTTDVNLKKIAVCWASAENTEVTRRKSIPYSQFKKLFNTPNCQFYSVQIAPDSNATADMNRRINVHDLGDRIIDFEDTAQILNQMDLVISVDTATAHLAGALGLPTWTLLPYAADWRWRMHRTDSPWYSSMRLFRQQRQGDWDQVLEEVTSCLFNYGAQMSTTRLATGRLLSA